MTPSRPQNRDQPIDPALRLRPKQRMLSPAQEAEAHRFAQERIAAQLSTEPVDRGETEALLRQVYQVAGLSPPKQIRWVNGPLHLATALALHYEENSAWLSVEDKVRHAVDRMMEQRVAESLRRSVWSIMRRSMWDNTLGRVNDGVRQSMEERMVELSARVSASLREHTPTCTGKDVRARVRESLEASLWESARAYQSAHDFAYYCFFDAYLAPNDLHALAHFNERVSGYWLSKSAPVIVRRPRLLACDEGGHLHSETGKCLEYHDGWGFYAWHGVQVSERVILAPERLSRDDFLHEPNVEVRRVIQERMGERFISELGGVVLDTGPRGTLYEVALPDDPEQVARYVQVQDVSTERRYVLRVPPSIQTAAEAVAWSFQMTVEAYVPAQET